MNRFILFQHKTSEISINIEAYFDGDKLVIEGYDIGKRVEEAFGDSDYEYSVIVTGDEVIKLYSLMQVKEYDGINASIDQPSPSPPDHLI